MSVEGERKRGEEKDGERERVRERELEKSDSFYSLLPTCVHISFL